MTSRRKWLMALLAAAALVLGACDGGGDGDADDADSEETTTTGDDEGDDDEEAAGSGEGCEVVTAEDAEVVLGEPVEEVPAETETPFAVAECVWGAVSDESFALLQYRVFDGPQFFSPETFEEVEGFEEIDGLGEGAYVTATPGSVDLYVLEDDRTVTLAASGVGGGIGQEGEDPAAVKTRLLALAEQVVG